MSQTLTRLGAAVGLAAVLAAPQAQAGIGDSLVASGGNIFIRFEGSDASFNSLISVNGSTPVFPNHSTAVGTTLDLGFFAPGTPLDIVLQVLTTGNSFHSGPGAGNADGQLTTAESTTAAADRSTPSSSAASRSAMSGRSAGSGRS